MSTKRRGKVKKSSAVLFIFSLVALLSGCGAMVGAYKGAQSDWKGFMSDIDAMSGVHNARQSIAQSDADALRKCEKFYIPPGRGDTIKRAGYNTCLQKEFGKTIASDEGCIRLVERECSGMKGKAYATCKRNIVEIAVIQKSRVFSDRRDEMYLAKRNQ